MKAYWLVVSFFFVAGAFVPLVQGKTATEILFKGMFVAVGGAAAFLYVTRRRRRVF